MKMLDQKNPTLTMASVLFLSFAVFSLTACKPKKGSIPKNAEARVDDFAQHLPSTTQGAVFVGDMGKMRSTLNTIKTEVGAVVPQVEVAQKEFTKELGLDIMDVTSYDAAGLADAGMGAGFVNDRVALMLYVKDPVKFDTFFAEKMKKPTKATGAAKAVDVNGVSVKVLGEGNDQVAWVHDGKMVIIGTPSAEGTSKVKVSDFVASLTTTKKETSLQSTSSYKLYKKAFPADKYALTIYGNAPEIVKTPQFKKAVDDAAKKDPGAKASVDWFEKNTEALALGVTQKGNELSARVYFGGKEATNKQIMALSKSETKAPWKKFASKKMILGMRISLNVIKGWEMFKTTMPAEERAKIEKNFKRDSEKLGMDLEKDILQNLTGNFGLFFHGVDLGALMAAQKNPMAALGGINLVIGLQVKDPAKVKTLIGSFVEKSEGKMKLADWNGGHKLDAGGMANVYLKDNLVIIGTGKVTDDEVKAYLDGKTEQPTNPLGQRFATDSAYNGIYINTSEVAALLGPLLAMEPRAAIIKRIDAVALESEMDENGASSTLKVHLKPQEGGAAPKK